jgi:P pilus assembly chaperone PapD
VDVGLGVYKLYVAYVNHDGKQETAMDQTGTFRLTGGKITFHNRSSYYVMTKDLPISFISTNTIKLGEFVYSIIR